jgi:hypothetical protein
MTPFTDNDAATGAVLAASAANTTSPKAVPHSPQKLSSGCLGATHFGQAAARSVAQLVQNLRPLRFIAAISTIVAYSSVIVRRARPAGGRLSLAASNPVEEIDLGVAAASAKLCGSVLYAMFSGAGSKNSP